MAEIKVLGELDVYLFAEGRHPRIFDFMGSHAGYLGDRFGTYFAVWAPRALTVAVIGDMNGWDPNIAYHLNKFGDSGIWHGFMEGCGPGLRYKYRIEVSFSNFVERSDPFARQAANPPSGGSIVAFDDQYQFTDTKWLDDRASWYGRLPMSIYEVHLGSFVRDPANPERILSYDEIGDALIPHVVKLGFTHIELMPINEHPFYGSWGYQTTSMYAPTVRYGSRDQLRKFVDRCHNHGIGVICDWVPAHFPKDEFALANFDGGPLFEKEDPRMANHGDWGTLVYNYASPHVRNFLIGSALCLMEDFHFDALRVDAVASMLYLDYSRGEWIPNKYGGNEDLEAIDFMKAMNEAIHQAGGTTIAEESTAFPRVSQPTYDGGLGFGFKWNMGWMHDTLSYLSRDPMYRSYHHGEITFGFHYGFSEHFILPLSHDEVVHGKGSLYRKFAGNHFDKISTVRGLFAWMWAHPGKKMIFMGNEFAQVDEWNHDRSLDWHLLESPLHHGVVALVSRLNDLYKSLPELFETDIDPSAFMWIRGSDANRNLFITMRKLASDSDIGVIIVANFSGWKYERLEVGVPKAGQYRELINSDSLDFSGGGVVNDSIIKSEAGECDGFANRISISIAANSVAWFRYVTEK
ncbi:MAG: 1,4-alpha-glucan branching protein GlgB [Actinomycetota bacterium]|nr:1,4-alpha-glucan branching protein GlgB [Actinomycetota bacterium]